MDDDDLAPLPSDFYPFIYESQSLLESVPEGFNAVRIALDASLTADLNWKLQREAAKKHMAAGLRIFWEIDLGLFHKLVYPIANDMQFQSLLLSLIHFRDTLWNEFRDSTIGLCLYSGPADFSLQFPWDDTQRANLHIWQSRRGCTNEKLFCTDVAAEYLNLFARQLPDALTLFICVDAQGIDDSLLRAQLLNSERFNRFQLIVKGSQGNVPSYGWADQPGLRGYMGRQLATPIQSIVNAVCFPNFENQSSIAQLADVFKVLDQHALRYRVIPESDLITEWDGLDYLFFTPHELDIQTKRKLKGFCAAGGTAVTAGEKAGLPQEITLAEFQKCVPHNSIRLFPLLHAGQACNNASARSFSRA